MAIELTWLGQGGFLIRCKDRNIVLDPYLSYSCEEAGGHTRIAPAPIDPNTLHADLFVITHDHMDHLDEGTLKKLDLTAHRFAAPATCRAHLAALGVPEGNLIAFDRGMSLTFGDVALHAVHAEHTEDSIGLVVSCGGRTVYFTADTLYSDALAQSAAPYAPDVLVACINGRWGNMDHNEAAQVARRLNVRLSIPTHYGMFAENTADPMDFVTAMGDAETQLLQMYRPAAL